MLSAEQYPPVAESKRKEMPTEEYCLLKVMVICGSEPAAKLPSAPLMASDQNAGEISDARTKAPSIPHWFSSPVAAGSSTVPLGS